MFVQGSWFRAGTHPLLEAHLGDVAADGSVLLVAAAQGLLVEETLCDGLLKAGALHLIHVHRTHACRQEDSAAQITQGESAYTELRALQPINQSKESGQIESAGSGKEHCCPTVL